MSEYDKKDEGDWIEKLLFPLTSMLGDLEELEVLTFEVKRMEYIQDDDLSSQVWEFLINIANDVRTIMEFQPNVLKKHESIEWKKLVKVGEILNDGGAALCWSIAWRMATRDRDEIKKVVLSILGLNDENSNKFT